MERNGQAAFADQRLRCGFAESANVFKAETEGEGRFVAGSLGEGADDLLCLIRDFRFLISDCRLVALLGAPAKEPISSHGTSVEGDVSAAGSKPRPAMKRLTSVTLGGGIGRLRPQRLKPQWSWRHLRHG